MPDEVSKCPLLCGWEVNVVHVGDADQVKCELCGEFTITATLSSTALAERESDEVESLLPYLRAYIRQANQRGEIVSLNTSNWKDLALPHKYTPTSIKITKLLELVASRSKPGFTVQINPAAEAPLVDATSTTEMRYLLRHLVSIGYLDEQGGKTISYQ